MASIICIHIPLIETEFLFITLCHFPLTNVTTLLATEELQK
jgi:hypothetical protein